VASTVICCTRDLVLWYLAGLLPDSGEFLPPQDYSVELSDLTSCKALALPTCLASTTSDCVRFGPAGRIPGPPVVRPPWSFCPPRPSYRPRVSQGLAVAPECGPKCLTDPPIESGNAGKWTMTNREAGGSGAWRKAARSGSILCRAGRLCGVPGWSISRDSQRSFKFTRVAAQHQRSTWNALRFQTFSVSRSRFC